MRLDVVGSGMVTPVGYQAPSSCAAIRVGISVLRETGFKLGGEWLRGVEVDAPEAGIGVEKLLWMASDAIDECLAGSHSASPGDTALALCLAESERPGRPARLDERFLANVCSRAEAGQRLGPHRKLFANGSVGGVEALSWADEVLEHGDATYCVVAGVDSYLHGPTLEAYYAARRLVAGDNLDGFFPGEAGAAVLLSRGSVEPVSIQCLGVGWGREHALQDSDKPLRGDGLANAYRTAFKSAGCGFPAVDYRLADIAGDQYSFKEAALALLRTMRVRKEEFTIWHPAESVGRVGAASVPLALGVALAAARRSYAPGPGALCHFTGESGVRGAVVLRQRGTPPAMDGEGWVRG